MSKSRTPQNRTKRNPRDPSPERAEQAKRDRDGVVEDEMEELDTDKYEPPPPRH